LKLSLKAYQVCKTPITFLFHYVYAVCVQAKKYAFLECANTGARAPKNITSFWGAAAAQLRRSKRCVLSIESKG
jgi:hypothetical protein